MLCIPLKPLASRHLFRIPAFNKAGIRPTGCTDENFSGFCFARRSFGHASTKSHPGANANKIVSFAQFPDEETFFRFAQDRHPNYSRNAGWSSLVARQAHNLKAAGSNPAPATNFFKLVGFRRLALAAAYRAGKIHAPQPREKKIQRSSVVERSAVNRLVVGSNPTAGAKFLGRISDFIRLSLKSRANGEDIFRITHCNRSSLTAVFITGIQWAFARC